MKNLEKVKEVSNIDQFIAVMDFLKAMGYDTSKLNVMDVTYLKGDIVRAIDNSEDPYAEFMNYKAEEGNLSL
jgi:hypothetical protein